MEPKPFDKDGNHPGTLKSSRTALAATGRKIFYQDLEEGLKLPKNSWVLPVDVLDGEMDGDLNPPLKTPPRLTIGIGSPPQQFDFPTPPPPISCNDWEMDEKTLGERIRERSYSSNSSTTLGSEEAQRLLDENIRDNNDSNFEDINPASIQPNDCLPGDRHEGSNCQQNQLYNDPRFEDDSASDSLRSLLDPCEPTVDRPLGAVYLIQNDFDSLTPIDDPIHRPTGGFVENVLYELVPIYPQNEPTALPANTACPTNDVASIGLDHGILEAIDLDKRLYKYQGAYGTFLVPIIDPLYAYEACENAYQELCNGHFVQWAETQPNQFKPDQRIDEGMTLEALNPSTEVKKTAGRPEKYKIKNIRPEESPQHARERETQERARGKKSDRLQKQNMAVTTAHKTLQAIGLKSTSKLMEVLKDHRSLQPGNAGKKNDKRSTRKTKSNHYKDANEKLAARRQSGQESAQRFRERENKRIDLFKKIIGMIGELEKMGSTNKRAKEDKKAIDRVINLLRSVPMTDGSPKKRKN
ncbi:unnamed protein product, partial [Mesorhabditis belari]|uniref:Uncharacterized protein n=1 Tax=Mesorhabditis belari TaxID=2138241 RepID=A0AAF3EZE3_9BILA